MLETLKKRSDIDLTVFLCGKALYCKGQSIRPQINTKLYIKDEK
jgi:hypothetical protein